MRPPEGAPTSTPDPDRVRAGRVVAWIGLVLHLGLAVFPYSATGLLAPLYGIAIVYAGWAVGVVLIVRWWRSVPKLVLLVPFLAIAWWFVVMFFGDFVLGWTA